MATKRKYTCFKCLNEQDEKNFFPSYSENLNITPICKNCFFTLYGRILSEVVSHKESIYLICKKFDIYCNSYIIDELEEEGFTGVDVAEKYISKIFNKSSKKYKDLSFKDSELNFTPLEEQYKTKVSSKEDILLWGEGFTDKEYEKLNNSFEFWKKTHNHDTASEIYCLKQICVLQLEIEKSRQHGGNVNSKLNEELRKWMNVAAVSPNAKKGKDDLNSKIDTYGLWIKEIEQEKPAEYFNDKELYDDYDGIKGYLTNYVFRPLKNLLTGSRDFDIKSDDYFKAEDTPDEQ